MFHPEVTLRHAGAHATEPAFGGEPFELLARRRREVVGARLGARALRLDDAAQGLTFATRAAAKRPAAPRATSASARSSPLCAPHAGSRVTRGMRPYTRKISAEEAKEGYVLVSKDRLKDFPPVGEDFILIAGEAEGEARVDAYRCTCRARGARTTTGTSAPASRCTAGTRRRSRRRSRIPRPTR